MVWPKMYTILSSLRYSFSQSVAHKNVIFVLGNKKSGNNTLSPTVSATTPTAASGLEERKATTEKNEKDDLCQLSKRLGK